MFHRSLRLNNELIRIMVSSAIECIQYSTIDIPLRWNDSLHIYRYLVSRMHTQNVNKFIQRFYSLIVKWVDTILLQFSRLSKCTRQIQWHKKS